MPPALQAATDAPNHIFLTAPVPSRLDEVWPFLMKGLDHIMNSSEGIGVSYLEYITLYTTVYNYFTSSLWKGTGDSKETSTYLRGRKLYDNLRRYFFDHLTPMVQKAATLSDEDLLRYYAAEWDRYTTGANYANRLFAFFNRHWVALAKTKEDVLPVYSLALAIWKENFLRSVHSNLSVATLRLFTKHRNGEAIDQDVVDKVLDSFLSLGLGNPAPISAKESQNGRG